MVARQFLTRKVVPVFLCFVLVFMLLAVPMQTKAEALAIEAVGGIVIAVIALAASTLGYTFTTQGGFRQACQNLYDDMDIGLKTQIETDVTYDSAHERLVVQPDAAFWSLLFDYVRLGLGSKGNIAYGDANSVSNSVAYSYPSVVNVTLPFNSPANLIPENYKLLPGSYDVLGTTLTVTDLGYQYQARIDGDSHTYTISKNAPLSNSGLYLFYSRSDSSIVLNLGYQYLRSGVWTLGSFIALVGDFFVSLASSADYSVSAGALPGAVVDDGWTDWTNAGSDEGEDNPPIPAYIPIPNTKVFDDVFGSEATAEDAMTATQTDTLTETGVLDFIDTVANPVLDDYQAAGSLDGTPVHLSDLFPFCIPFDIFHMIQGLQHNREAPHFEWNLNVPDLVDYTFEIDLSDFDTVAVVLRSMELLLFCVGLAMVTRSLIRG